MTPPGALPTRFDIPIDKITKFLLNLQGRKPERAIFFVRLGFDPARPEELGQALYRHAARANHVGVSDNAFGRSLIYEGPLWTPTGSARDIRSIWQVDLTADPDRARFGTAYRYR